jgi:hypothetical protein
MKSKSILIGIAIIASFMSSCEKEGPAGPAGPTLKGTVIGFVTLYDEFGSQVSDKSGVTVTVEGVTPSISVTTNSVGKYQIDDLPTGTYDLTFGKLGYSTYRSLGFSFVGGEKPRVYNVSLSQQSTTIISNLSLSISSSTTMVLSGTVSPTTPTGSSRYFRFYFGRSNPVTSTNYLTTAAYGGSGSTFTITRTIDKSTFPSGSTIYVVAFGDASYGYGYPDLTSGLYIYSTISTTGSNIASIVVP